MRTGRLRYIALEVNPHSRSYDTPFKLKAHSLYTTIIKKIEQLYGDFGVAALKGGFIAKYCNEKTRVAFVRARHGPHRLLASCLPLVNRIENHQVMLRILYTGATLRQCYKFIQRKGKLTPTPPPNRKLMPSPLALKLSAADTAMSVKLESACK
uniref:(California timema) hypothetical protein n=1 Tax=Timema californicum TaxID=61474 RepID=A0A7R9J770_TIMCA|nr:unnamed protein product [Timema californicum]